MDKLNIIVDIYDIIIENNKQNDKNNLEHMDLSNIVWSNNKENNQIINEYLNNIFNLSTYYDRIIDKETNILYRFTYESIDKTLLFYFVNSKGGPFFMNIQDNKVGILKLFDTKTNFNDQINEVGDGLLGYIRFKSKLKLRQKRKSKPKFKSVPKSRSKLRSKSKLKSKLKFKLKSK